MYDKYIKKTISEISFVNKSEGGEKRLSEKEDIDNRQSERRYGN